MLLVAAALAGGTNRLLQPVVQAKEASGKDGGPPGQVRTLRDTEGEGSIIKAVMPTQVKGTDLSWGEVFDGLQAGVGLCTDEKVHRLNPPLQLVVKVRNVGVGPRTLTFPEDPLEDFLPKVVHSSGKPLRVKMPPFDAHKRRTRVLTLNPGEVKEIGNPWITFTPARSENIEEAEAVEPARTEITVIVDWYGYELTSGVVGEVSFSYDGFIRSHPRLATWPIGLNINGLGEPEVHGKQNAEFKVQTLHFLDVVIEEVDAAHNTITVTIGLKKVLVGRTQVLGEGRVEAGPSEPGKLTRLVNLPVGKPAAITISSHLPSVGNHQPRQLTELKPGMPASLELVLNEGELGRPIVVTKIVGWR